MLLIGPSRSLSNGCGGDVDNYSFDFHRPIFENSGRHILEAASLLRRNVLRKEDWML
jgi:hypothetical protein